MRSATFRLATPFLSWPCSNPAISALTARYASPPEAASCPDFAAACHLHWLCGLAQRERVTCISGEMGQRVR